MICDACPLDTEPFMSFGNLVLCAKCSQAVIQELNSASAPAPDDGAGSGVSVSAAPEPVSLRPSRKRRTSLTLADSGIQVEPKSSSVQV